MVPDHVTVVIIYSAIFWCSMSMLKDCWTTYLKIVNKYASSLFTQWIRVRWQKTWFITYCCWLYTDIPCL